MLITERGYEKVSMIRIYYTGRRLETIPAGVQPYCKYMITACMHGSVRCVYVFFSLPRIGNGRLVLPSLSELKQYRIVVVTLSTSRALSLMGLPRGHFSHIFIDEAAQVKSHSYLHSSSFHCPILPGSGVGDTHSSDSG